MALFFGGNPFSTPVGKKIEQATEASLISENWSLNMEICDLINDTEDGAKDAMKAIKKRLNQNNIRNFTVVMYTLTVLETCVKNCQRKFLLLVCNKEFIQELVKLIGPKNDPPAAVQQKVLNLIQCWAEAFKHQPELYGVVQVYTELKQKGIEFPVNNLDSGAPILTPKRNCSKEEITVTNVLAKDSAISNSLITLNPDQLGKLTSELRVVEGNMAVLSEMLNELVPGKESPSDWELLKEVYNTCQAMQQRLVELINELANDDITAELLRVNDGLNNLFLRYSRFEKNRISVSKEIDDVEDSLIDLNDKKINQNKSSVHSQFSSLSLTPNHQNSLLTSATENSNENESNLLDHSRDLPYGTLKTKDNTSESCEDIKNFSKGLNTVNQASNNLEQDFDEMAAWLGEKQEESLTSSEFENFLAERAAAAESLPLNTENFLTHSNSTSQNKESTFSRVVEIEPINNGVKLFAIVRPKLIFSKGT